MTEAGRVRLGMAEDRLRRYAAEHLEHAEAKQALAQGENVEDVRDVPAPASAEDPFQTFAPLDVEPLQLEARAREAGSLPASSHEPMVLPDETPLPEPVIAAPGLAADNGGMDVDVVVASDFDGGQVVPAAVGCTGAMQAQAPCLTASEALSRSPVRQDVTDGDEQAMGEIVADVSKLRAAKPAEECDGENDDVEDEGFGQKEGGNGHGESQDVDFGGPARRIARARRRRETEQPHRMP